jgi:hypothetical protein
MRFRRREAVTDRGTLRERAAPESRKARSPARRTAHGRLGRVVGTARATCWDSSSRRSRRHPDHDPALSASPLIGPAGSCCRIAVLHTHLPLPSAAGPRIPEPSSPLPGPQIKHLCARNGARPESRPVAPNGGSARSRTRTLGDQRQWPMYAANELLDLPKMVAEAAGQAVPACGWPVRRQIRTFAAPAVVHRYTDRRTRAGDRILIIGCAANRGISAIR